MAKTQITTRRVITILKPIMVGAREGAQIMGVSRVKFYELDKRGVIVGTTALGDKMWSVEHLREVARRITAEAMAEREQDRQAHLARRPLAAAGGRR